MSVLFEISIFNLVKE